MTKVIGVRFRQASKIYFFAPGKLQIEKGDQVIVETARGVEFGNVVVGPKEVPDEDIMQPLKSVIRVATEEDKKIEEKKLEKTDDTNTGITTEQFNKMNYHEKAKLFKENPEQYAELNKN